MLFQVHSLTNHKYCSISFGNQRIPELLQATDYKVYIFNDFILLKDWFFFFFSPNKIIWFFFAFNDLKIKITENYVISSTFIFINKS